ncbi:hypothetical protein [Natrinema salinisoli]|uniref:hypothetical protein n=1 Tax=Natrinema salinisoli TaxID=2878535 RepID=UPI001CF0B236|nr:hypothetical protein [Natrinema salinisoli]
MDSRTRNIFFQPRYESDAQYEQNVVKHLVTVLERTDDSITESVLTDLLPKFWTATDEEIMGYVYDIEVYPSDNPDYDEAYILGLSNYRTQIEEVESEEKDGRADGQISAITPKGDQVFSIIIEAKTGSETLSSEQLNRYKQQFEALEIATAEWADVYSSFADLEVEEGMNDFLVDQYAEFLLNEEMEGVIAESTITDSDDNNKQVNQILIRYEPDLEGEPYAFRFLSWYRDSANDDFVLYYSAWLSADDFRHLFSQVERHIRRETFIGVENDEGDIEPSLDPLIEWAKNGGYGPSEGQEDFQGSHQAVVAEIKDRNGHYPELRLKGGDALRFSRMTENNSANIQKPTHYTRDEFAKLMSELDRDLRESMFVEFDFEPLWNEFTGR